jgi:phage-related protein
MPSLTDVFVTVKPDLGNFDRDVKTRLSRIDSAAAGKNVGSRFGGAFAGAAKAALAGAAVLGVAAVGTALKVSISAASDLNETVSKSNTIFGKNAGTINKWASTASTSLGLTRQQAIEGAASFGDMFSQIGFTRDAAARMSTTTVQLAADLGSFNNLPTADVQERISAAFRGEYDSLQMVIPNINAARVEQVALATTGKETARQLTAQEKAAAVLAIVQKDGARAAGDFARTQGGVANQTKIAKAQIGDMAAQAGTMLLPALTKVFGYVTSTALPAISGFVDGMRTGEGAGGRFAEIMKSIGSALSTAARFIAENKTVLGGLAVTIGTLVGAAGAVVGVVKVWTAAQTLLNVALAANPIGLVVIGLAALAAGVIYAYKNSETFRKVINAIGSAIKTGFLAAVQAVTGWLSRFAAAFNTELIQPVRRAGQAVAEAWEKIKSATATVFQAIGKVIGGAIQAWLAVIKFELTVIGTAFLLAWELLKFITKSVFGFIADKIIKPIWKTISTIFSTAQTALSAAWGKFWGVLSSVASRVWTAVRDKVIKPIWTSIQTVFTTAFSLLKERWSRFWGALRAAAKAVFEAIRDKVISPIWGNIKTTFSNAHTWVREKWSGFWGGIKQTAKDAMDRVLERIGTVLGKVKTAFSTAKTNIGKAWSGVKGVVSAPINWVKDNVYNKPLVPVWNRVAKLVDGPTLSAYARGGIHGVRPGYTPGRDTHTIAVGGGEAIMRPEWTRAMGADYVNSANRAARTGGVRKVQEMAAQFRADGEGDPGERVPTAAFARGGIVGAVMRSVKGTAGKVIGKLKDWYLGGLAAVAGKALNPLKGVIDRAMPASGVGRTVGGIGKKAIDLVLAKIKGADAAPGGGPMGGGGAAVGGGRGAARLAGLRLGASSVGTYPGHQPSMNKAWDFMATGATGNRIAGHLAANRKQYGISYLIWNRRMLRDYPHGNIAPGSWGPYFDGNSSNPNRAHTNHVHASFYRNGGIVPEGGLAGGGVVKGGRGGVTAQVGEGRFDELVAPLPRGWKMGGAGKDAAVDRLIAAIEAHGLGSTEFSFVTHNPIAEPQSVTTNKALQRVSNLGLV